MTQEINRLAATTPAAHARREQQAARVGQVWKSTDRREDRWVRVVEIDVQFAVVEPCDPDGEPHHNPRRTRVRLSPTGRLNRYRLVQDPPLPGLGEDTDQRRSERPTTPTPTHTTLEASSAAYGHAAAVKRWQLPPEPDVPQLRDPAGCRWQRDPAGWTRVDEADDPAWRDWPWWRLLVRRGPLTAAPVARTSSPTMSDPTTVPCDCSCHRCCVPMDASCEDCEDNHDDH